VVTEHSIIENVRNFVDQDQSVNHRTKPPRRHHPKQRCVSLTSLFGLEAWLQTNNNQRAIMSCSVQFPVYCIAPMTLQALAASLWSIIILCNSHIHTSYTAVTGLLCWRRHPRFFHRKKTLYSRYPLFYN